VVSTKTCPHGPEHKVAPSGTKVRELLKAGKGPANEFSRPEIADYFDQVAQARQIKGRMDSSRSEPIPIPAVRR